MILAAALVEHDRVFGNVKSAVAKAVFYIDENIGKIAAGYNNVLGLIAASAGRVLTHVDLGGLRCGAVEFYGAIHRGYSGGIDGSGCRCRLLGGRIRRLLRVLLLVACRKQE